MTRKKDKVVDSGSLGLLGWGGQQGGNCGDGYCLSFLFYDSGCLMAVGPLSGLGTQKSNLGNVPRWRRRIDHPFSLRGVDWVGVFKGKTVSETKKRGKDEEVSALKTGEGNNGSHWLVWALWMAGRCDLIRGTTSESGEGEREEKGGEANGCRIRCRERGVLAALSLCPT